MRAITNMFRRLQSADLYTGKNGYLSLNVENNAIVLKTKNLKEVFEISDVFKRNRYLDRIVTAYLKATTSYCFEESVEIIKREFHGEETRTFCFTLMAQSVSTLMIMLAFAVTFIKGV